MKISHPPGQIYPYCFFEEYGDFEQQIKTGEVFKYAGCFYKIVAMSYSEKERKTVGTVESLGKVMPEMPIIHPENAIGNEV